MPAIPGMKYTIRNKVITLELPLTSQGKFRCKTRDDDQDFGRGFAPKTNCIPANAYLEWQIGYDTIIGANEKPTSMDSDEFIFVGANGKYKHPYELSEIMYEMCRNQIYTKTEIEELIRLIESTNTFLVDEYKIKVLKEDPTRINNIGFLCSSTKLPTFLLKDENSGLMIEIMIEKQQYATGVQPMLYMIVPMAVFANRDKIIDRTSAQTPFGQLNISDNCKELVRKLFICFGMCSEAHNHDILQILELINENAF